MVIDELAQGGATVVFSMTDDGQECATQLAFNIVQEYYDAPAACMEELEGELAHNIVWILYRTVQKTILPELQHMFAELKLIPALAANEEEPIAAILAARQQEWGRWAQGAALFAVGMVPYNLVPMATFSTMLEPQMHIDTATRRCTWPPLQDSVLTTEQRAALTLACDELGGHGGGDGVEEAVAATCEQLDAATCEALALKLDQTCCDASVEWLAEHMGTGSADSTDTNE